MGFQKKLFAVLWLAGFLGILSLLVTTPPQIAGVESQISPLTLQLLSLIQPTLLLTVAAWIGVSLAHNVNLSAPCFEAIARQDSPLPALKLQIIPGLIGGLVGGLSLPLIFQIWRPFLPLDFITKSAEFSPNLSILTRLLYGGITEEILLRWGLMTLFVWIGWRFFQHRTGFPNFIGVGLAILLSAILFGVAHLPVVFLLTAQPSVSLISYIIVANSLFGLVAGYLYWKKGLEAAMIAHAVSHCVILIINAIAA